MQSIRRDLFLKDGALRARWRFLIFAVLFSYCDWALFLAARPLFRLPRVSAPLQAVLIWSLSFLAAAISTAVMARLDRQPWGAYGLPVRGAFGVLFWKGMLWGLCACTGLLLALRLAGVFHFGEVLLHGAEAAEYAGSWALAFLMLALFELSMLLGYPRVLLTKAAGFWPASGLLAAFFGAIHFVRLGWVSGLATGLTALLFCLTLRRTGSLWFVVGMHTAFNWSGTFLYSVPENGKPLAGQLLSTHLQGPVWLTGGSIGPENGVWGFLMLAVLFAAFHRAYPAPVRSTGGGIIPHAQ